MPPIPTINDLLLRQRAYYEVLSTWESRPWGVIGANPDNPTSHDSNHAYATGVVTTEALPQVLREVAAWCDARGVEPSLFRFHIPPQDPALLEMGPDLGWRATTFDGTWRVWPASAGRDQAPPVPGLTMAFVGPEALDDLETTYAEDVGAEARVRMRGVWDALCRSERVVCLLGRINGEPAASLACVWNGDWGSIEDVHTRSAFRRRGICRAMVGHVQGHAGERQASGLYLYNTEEGPGRAYERCGLRLLATVREACLWRER